MVRLGVATPGDTLCRQVITQRIHSHCTAGRCQTGVPGSWLEAVVMRFRIERDALGEAVAWVARALPSRPVVPVLSGMLIEAGDGLALSCFDYDVSARFEVKADVIEPGSA